MADWLKTPLGEVRWFKLVGEARPNQFDPNKAKQWTTDFILDNANHEHAEFLVNLEDQYRILHGAAKKHNHAFPWKLDSNKAPDGKIMEDATRTILKFKTNQFKTNDGGKSAGPVLMDAVKKPWDHTKELANGSKCIIAFEIYPWTSATGSGLLLQPKAVMIVDYIPFEKINAADFFDVVPNGFVASDEIPF